MKKKLLFSLAKSEGEQFLAKVRAGGLKAERSEARKEQKKRVFGNIKGRASNLSNQIKKIFDETDQELQREIAKLDPQEAKERMRKFEQAYARNWESLSADANMLTPAQIAWKRLSTHACPA